MFTTMLTIVKVIIVASILVTISHAAPKKSRYDSNKPNKESYDQKQTGDYNIRLHLKDFQIIALLNDGFGDLGDYDYNYDYSELTIKPVIPIFTTPSTTSTSSTTSAPVTASTGNNNAVTVTEQQLSTNDTPTVTTEKLENLNLNQFTEESNGTKLVNSTTSDTIKPVNSTLPDSDIIFLHNTTKPLDNETLIAVQVLYEALNGNSLIKSIPIGFESNKIPIADKTELNKANSTTIEPSTEAADVLGDNQTIVTDNSHQLATRRRCLNGFRKDKLGRCRRLRRPGIPIEVQLGRLASKIRKAGVSMLKKS